MVGARCSRWLSVSIAAPRLGKRSEARRETRVIDPAAQQAILDRILVLVTPQPSSQRLLRRAWRSAQRLGADLDVLWVRGQSKSLTHDQTVALAALRRLTAILAADVAGYSRLMHNDEEATHARLTMLLADALEPSIAQHGGHGGQQHRPRQSPGERALLEHERRILEQEPEELFHHQALILILERPPYVWKVYDVMGAGGRSASRSPRASRGESRSGWSTAPCSRSRPVGCPCRGRPWPGRRGGRGRD